MNHQKQKKNLTFKKLLNTVCYFLNVKPKDVLSPKRRKDVVKARQIIAYFAREKLHESYPNIGKKLGNRNHTTAIHSYNKVKEKLNNEENTRKEIEIILQELCDSGKIELCEKPEENIFARREKKKAKKEKELVIVKCLDDFPIQNLSKEHLKRQINILEKYKAGWTLEEIGNKYKITRERARQIIERALIDSAKEIVEEGIPLNLKEFLQEERNKHWEMVRKRRGIPSRRSLSVSGEENRWSRYYDSCRNCGTTVIHHHSHGYCRKCYPKTDIYKGIQQSSRLRNIDTRKKAVAEYAKRYHRRPEVIAKVKKKSDLKFFGGQREKVILRDKEKCRRCGMSRQKSLERNGKDLFVLHIGDVEDNRPENLITLCPSCFSAAAFKKRKKGGKKE